MKIIRFLKDDSALQLSQSLQAATFPRSANLADMVFDGNPGDKVLHRHLCSFMPTFMQLVLSLVFAFFAVSGAQAQVILPIEVMGAEGTEVNVTLSLTAGQVAATQRLWLQTHNIRYPEKASLRINGGAWVPLNNTTATMLATSQTYGGIGGSFAVLKMTLPVTPSQLVTGNNTLTFRFNVSNGLATGYRIVKMNLLDASGTQLMPASAFTQENPATWLPPSSASADIAAGENLWRNAPLMASYRPGAQPIMAKCASCHTQNGADLQYFSYSNHAIIERSKFHGLSATQGSQIASYIRNLAVKKAGRPWNPPYQPGPGLTDKPNDEWLAGAGIDNVLDDDSDTLLAMFPNGVRRDALMEGDTNKFKRFSSHDSPLSFQLPDWNHWLPEIHPVDATPSEFAASSALGVYNSLRSQLNGRTPAQIREWVRTSNAGAPQTGLFLLKRFYSSNNELAKLKYPGLISQNNSYTDPAVAREIYSFALWKMVKLVEVHEEFGLTGLGRIPEDTAWANYESRDALPRMWLGADRTVFDSSPFLSSLEDGVTGSMSGNNAFNFQYLSNSWYQLQLILNGGQRTGFNHQVVDFGYSFQFTSRIERLTNFTQMGRHYIWCLKGMDEGDNDRGPNQNDGWSFNRATLGPVMPYISMDKTGGPAISSHSRAALSLLVQVWQEKNNSWLPEQIFAYANGTQKSGNEDGVQFDLRTWQIGSGNNEYQSRSIGQNTFNDMGKIKTQNTLPPALLNGYAQWAQVMWPGLDANGTAQNNWMQFVYPRVGTAPSAPTLQNTATPGDIRVSWTPAAGVASYNVKRSTTAAGPFLTVAYFRTSGEYTDSVPLQNREYYYKLSANTAAGESSDSPATFSFLLLDRLLGTFIGTAPSNDNKTREATDGDRHTIASAMDSAAWTGLDLGSAQPITRIGFVPQRAYSIRSIGGKFQASNSANFSSDVVDLYTIAIDPGDGYEEVNISVGGTYRYVRYLIPTGNGHHGQIAEVTFWKSSAAAIAPPAPTGLAATAGNAQVALSWNASSGATSYTLKRATTSGGPYANVVTQAGTSYTNTGLTNGTTYYFVVSASNTAGSSANSTQVSATPAALPAPPAPPSSLSATAASSSEINLSWTDNASNETGFKIERETGTGGTYSQIGTAGANAATFSDTGLTASTQYNYRVRANNAIGDSAYSNEANATTQATGGTGGGGTAVDRTDETGSTITARASINAGEDHTKAFDNSASTKWLDNGGVPSSSAPSWIGFEFSGTGYAINRYTITSANDEPARDPKSWRLKASNSATPDWSTATVLNTQTSQTFANRLEKRIYDFTNMTVYKNYRLEITENFGNSTHTQLAEIELLTTTTTTATVATPTFSLAGGIYTSTQSVTISTTTSGATIRYTTNGSDPTSGSTAVSGAISIAATTTLKARAFLSGATDSGVAMSTYTINTSSGGGGGTAVDRTDETGSTITARASINAGEDHTKAFDNSASTKWLDNGGVPSSSAPSWIGFEFSGTGYAINRYTITSASDEPARDPKSWRLKASNSATPDWSTATVLNTQTGQTFANRLEKKIYDFTNMTVYKNYRLEITENFGNSTHTQLAEIELLTTTTTTTTATVATPTFSLAGGIYTSTQSVTISTTTSGATIRYTTNGSDPTSGSTAVSGAISIAATTTLKARAFLSGATDSGVAMSTYTIDTSSGGGGGTAVDRTDETGSIITARASASAGEDHLKAFDNSTSTKWLDNSGVPTSSAPSWIGFEFAGTGYAINRYTITSANDHPARDPRSWRLKGSNATTPDWSSATVLNTQSAQTFTNRFEKKTYDFTNTTVYKKYRLEITENFGGGDITQLAEIELLTSGSGGSITREVWTGVTGTTISAIPVTTTPNITDTITSFEVPINAADNYGTRVRGYLTAPATGSYTFWVSGDDNCELWLSTDGSSTNKVSRATVNSWTDSREWTRESNQKSVPIDLQSGQKYYIEALQKEGGGGDSLAVGWSRPGESIATPSEIIPGAVLSPFTSGPENGAVYEIEPQNALGKRLDVSGGSGADGAAVQLWTDTNGNNQRWKLEEQGVGTYELIPQHATAKRLDVNASSSADGTNVQIWADNNINAQRWKFELQADGSYEIIPQHDGTKRLKVNGGGPADGTPIQSWADDNSPAVRWKLIKQ